MKFSVLTIVVLFIITTVLSSCCHEIQCTNGNNILNNLSLMNFTRSEIDTVIVRRFAQQTNFAVQMDSLILDSLNCQIVFYPYDSIPVYSIFRFVNNSFNIVPGYDYEIFVPATNTLETISNILQPQSEQKVCSGAEYTPTGCTNSITSLYVNGKPQENTTVIYVYK